MKLVTASILLLLFFYQMEPLHGEWSNTVCIVDNSSTAPRNCGRTSNGISQSLLNSLSNDTMVYIISKSVIINESLYLSNKYKIGFSSIKDISEIKCDSILHVGGTHSHKAKGYGMRFDSITSLSLYGLSFTNCGSLHNSTSVNNTCTSEPPQVFRSSLYLLNCTDIEFNAVSITESKGTGLTLFDCNGAVNIINCEFSHNRVWDEEKEVYSGGNGVYIEFTYCSPDWYTVCDSDQAGKRVNNANSRYRISNSNFINNTASRLIPHNGDRTYNRGKSFRGLGKGGGGLSVIVKGKASNNVFDLESLTFSYNKVQSYCFGGALYLHFQDSPSGNVINIRQSHFNGNMAGQGSGAIDMAFYFSASAQVIPTNNTINISDTHFKNNSAMVGGGVTFCSSSSNTAINPNNSVSFDNCHWSHNNASSGAAVMIINLAFLPTTNDILPEPLFINCTFESNKIKSFPIDGEDNQRQRGSGTLYVRLFTIHFQGIMNFTHNHGSALYAVNSIINVMNCSDVTFLENRGGYGGAITLIGLSTMRVGIDVSFNFTSNRATVKGGAIYVFSIDKLSSHTFGLCFIEYAYDSNDGERRATFVFEGNLADTTRGNAIYTSSLQPCSLLCPSNHMSNLTSEYIIFNCIGNMSFPRDKLSEYVGTDGNSYVPNQPITNEYIPGKAFQLPVYMVDEVGNRLETILLRGMLNNSEKIKLKLNYTHDYRFTLIGDPGSKAMLHVETFSFTNISFKMNVILSECSPGFVFKNGKCHCSVSKDSWNYNGIFTCDNKKFQAQLYIGYYAGYISYDDARPKTLITSTCPLGYCECGNSTEISLPSNPSASEVDKVICKPVNRTGIICGDCIENHSVYYHSFSYRCGPNDYCHLGILFYLLSEILPVTIVFTAVIMLRLNFTSGYLNGYVLFAQMLDSLSLSANGAVLVEHKAQTQAMEALHVLYSPFNLNFFQIESLSFCLFEGGNFLHVTSMKFLTLSFALVLILVLVLVMRCGCCYKLQLFCFKSRLTNSTSLIRGLSAFLVLSYGLCCDTCYKILNIALPTGKGQKGYPPRVFRMGTLEYLSSAHLPYALLAFFFFLVLAVVPPLFLFFQPLGYRFLPERVLNYAKTRWIFRKIELASPFLDTFQGCFKDRYRFFAGLYLMYRSVAGFSFAATNNRFEVYIITEVLLVIMLGVHAWIQPYKEKIHNHIDTGIFLIMLIVNTLTMYRFHETQVQTKSNVLEFVTGFQLFLVFVPAACLAFAVIFHALRWLIKATRCSRRCSHGNDGDDDSLPDLLMSQSRRWSWGRSTSFTKPEQLVLKYNSLNDSSDKNTKSTIKVL